MGIGGAFIMPATLSILTNVFKDPKERAKAIAIWAGCSGLGVALGPVTGGWLLEHFSWGSVFLVNLPVLVLGDRRLRRAWYPTSKDPHAPKLDIGGAVAVDGRTGALLWALIEAPERGWTSPTDTASRSRGAVAVLAVFGRWESRQAEPMLDLRLFTQPAVQRGKRCGDDDLLRAVRLAVPRDPVHAVGHGLHGPAGGHPLPAARRDAARDVTAVGEARRADRDQGRRHRRPVRWSPSGCC